MSEIEIEKKFILTPAQQAALLEGAVVSGAKKVEDSYLDTSDWRLSLNDFWFRLRDGAYELKAPLKSGSGSQNATNRYYEITDLEKIAEALQVPAGDDFEARLESAGIAPYVTCFTDRKTYEKDGFHIDIDAATYANSDFTYAVVEVEYLIKTEDEADEAERKIIAFAEKFGLATDQIILGKIAAYLQVEAPAHYEAVRAAGVFK